MKIMHIVGARPNFMKIAPIMAEMAKYPNYFEQVLVHTGQHYDFNMSEIFFQDLGIAAPDEFLGVGSGSHAEQTAQIMLAFEPILLKHRPDWVVVVGDVNSTLACALVCSKLDIRIAHVEAGLRSGDRTMPEEVNRILTDQISDMLFTPSIDGNENLVREGIDHKKIHFVGNVMIDTLIKMLPQIQQAPILDKLGIDENSYVLTTLHRPANVDNPRIFSQIWMALLKISEKFPVIFPIHPRTRKKMMDLDLDNNRANILLIEPQGYLNFLKLIQSARLVITDSGGVQEETTFLDVPCLTIRPNTERPITVQKGSNQLVDSTLDAIMKSLDKAIVEQVNKQAIPALELWDGRSAERIVQCFISSNQVPS